MPFAFVLALSLACEASAFSSARANCAREWQRRPVDQEGCPYGLGLIMRCCPYGWNFLGVTFPDPSRARYLKGKYNDSAIVDDWLDNDLIQHQVFTVIFVIYGYVAYGLIVLVLVHMGKLLWKEKKVETRELSFIIFAGLATFVNEIILKNLIQQKRPEHSCTTSCGMPSGHSVLSMGYLTIVLLDIILRVYYFSDDDDDHGGNPFEMAARCTSGLGKFKEASNPFSGRTEIRHADAMSRIAIWLMTLLPVPLSRIALSDHTPSQVLVGSLLGIISGAVYTWAIRCLQYKYFYLTNSVVTEYRQYKITHNFSLPSFVVRAKWKQQSHMYKQVEEKGNHYLQNINAFYEKSKGWKPLKFVATHDFEPNDTLGIDHDENGFVTSVEASGAAHSKGIRKGNQILKVDGKSFSKDLLDRAQKSGSAYKVMITEPLLGENSGASSQVDAQNAA